MKFKSGDKVRHDGYDLEGRVTMTDALGRVHVRFPDTYGWYDPDDLELVRRITVENITLVEYYDALERFDWYFDFSDDHRVWSAGNKRKAELISMSKKGAEYKALWDGFKEFHFSGEPWNTEKAPKPERPVEVS